MTHKKCVPRHGIGVFEALCKSYGSKKWKTKLKFYESGSEESEPDYPHRYSFLLIHLAGREISTVLRLGVLHKFWAITLIFLQNYSPKKGNARKEDMKENFSDKC
jgi:hypothetical protein